MKYRHAAVVLITMVLVLLAGCRALQRRLNAEGINPKAEQQCLANGWHKVSLTVAGIPRNLLWKGPDVWRNGAIVILHGGGGAASDFCSGGRLVQPQINFTRMAIKRGFAVFALDSTNDKVTDVAGKTCGKRFDFSVLNRPNLDVPFIRDVVDQVIPQHRPQKSSLSVFLTGLSTGGYMVIRAATALDDRFTAFAPISAGDPYGTYSNCDPSLSPRKSAKGILQDNETHKEITEDRACSAAAYRHEACWQSANPLHKPGFKQFQDRSDGIVDLSCMEKANVLLKAHGYPDHGVYLIGSTGKKSVWKHLWQNEYNVPLLDFLESEVRKN